MTDVDEERERYYEAEQPADADEWAEPYDGYVYDAPTLEYRGILYE